MYTKIMMIEHTGTSEVSFTSRHGIFCRPDVTKSPLGSDLA